jgi:hypothetical protein
MASNIRAFFGKTKRRGFGYAISVFIYFLRRYYYLLILKLSIYNSKIKYTNQYQISNDIKISFFTSEYFKKRKSPFFHFQPDEIEKIINAIPEKAKNQTIEKAANALEYRFNFRNIENKIFQKQIDWHYIPKKNISWNWDLNRHFFFIDLIKAYYYTGKQQYYEQAISLWEDWIEKNKPGASFLWAYPFEVAARLNNWIWAFFLLINTGQLPDETLQRLLKSMHKHADYLYWNLELHWPNNHLFLEAKVLLEFSLLFPELDHNKKFFNRAETIFKREVECQILPDGVHSELCSMYHRIITGELTEIVVLGEKNNLSFLSNFNKIKDRMINFSKALQREDGTVPLTGDSALDDTYIRFDLAQLEKTDMNYWLLPMVQSGAPESYRKNNLLAINYPCAGYAFIEDKAYGRDIHIMFDYGDFSKNKVSDHAHCDALSFEVYAAGKRLFIDPGVYFPGVNKLYWFNYFRSTSAHNTVMIDNLEQSQLWRASDVKKTARVNLLSFTPSAHAVTIKALCVPYWSKTKGISHLREFTYYSDKKIVINDYITGSGRHTLKWFFHLAPDIALVERDDGGFEGLSKATEYLFSLTCYGRERLQSHIAIGQHNPLLGWVSYNCSEVVPSSAIQFQVDTELPFDCKFIIQLP